MPMIGIGAPFDPLPPVETPNAPKPGDTRVVPVNAPDGTLLSYVRQVYMAPDPAVGYPGGWEDQGEYNPPKGAGGEGDALGWANLAQRKTEFEQTLDLNKQQLMESKAQTLIQGFNAMINAGQLTDQQAINKFNAEMTEYDKLIDNINTTYKNNFESWNVQNIDDYNRQVAEQTRQLGLMGEATTRGRDVAQNILPSLIGATPFNAEKYYGSMGIPGVNPQAISQTPYAPAPVVPELPAVPTGGYQPTPVPTFDIEELRRKLGLI